MNIVLECGTQHTHFRAQLLLVVCVTNSGSKLAGGVGGGGFEGDADIDVKVGGLPGLVVIPDTLVQWYSHKQLLVCVIFLSHSSCYSLRAHAAELGNTVPKEPLLFLKPTSSYLEEGGAIVVRQPTIECVSEYRPPIAKYKVENNITSRYSNLI